jgi:hypothetical protein
MDVFSVRGMGVVLFGLVCCIPDVDWHKHTHMGWMLQVLDLGRALGRVIVMQAVGHLRRQPPIAMPTIKCWRSSSSSAAAPARWMRAATECWGRRCYPRVCALAGDRAHLSTLCEQCVACVCQAILYIGWVRVMVLVTTPSPTCTCTCLRTSDRDARPWGITGGGPLGPCRWCVRSAPQIETDAE